MDRLAKDLSVALEESENCGKWGMRRRTRSAGNLHIYTNKVGEYQSDDTSSSNSELRAPDRNRSKYHSDSDDMSINFAVGRAINTRSHSLRVKSSVHHLFRNRYNKMGISHSLESDSFNEHSPARPNLRRKRKLKRMSIDEAPMPPCGKRKRPQRFEIIENNRGIDYNSKIKPLHQSIVDKINRFCQTIDMDDCNKMETQYIDCDAASESSVSWSGDEGHEGDDELTDWAPPQEGTSAAMDQSWTDADPREIRAGCRRLREERPGFSISTGANERVAKFLQDTNRLELRLFGAKHEKLGQLASLYSLEYWFNGSSSLLKKTSRTPCMQPTQRHHSGHIAPHKKIRTDERGVI